MGPLDLIFHLTGFAAPALFLALLLPLLDRIFVPKRPPALNLWAQVAINLIVGLVVLAAGLWLFGRDGKMATYAALAAAVASSQWFASRAWK